MAKTKSSSRTKGKKKSSSVGILNLQKIVILLSGKKYDHQIKEGHFAVMAADDHDQLQLQLRRFIVPLSFLTHPSFLQLLDQAAEEYGFDHHGALTLPCSPAVLHRILNEERNHNIEGGRDSSVQQYPGQTTSKPSASQIGN